MDDSSRYPWLDSVVKSSFRTIWRCSRPVLACAIGAHFALCNIAQFQKWIGRGPERSPGRSCTSVVASAVRRPSGDEPSTCERSSASQSSCGGRCPSASQQSSPSPCVPASLSSLQSWPCSYLSLLPSLIVCPKNESQLLEVFKLCTNY